MRPSSGKGSAWTRAGDRAGRGDDALEEVSRRLAVFAERTEPLLDFYRERGVRVTRVAVTAAMTASEMCDELERAIREG